MPALRESLGVLRQRDYRLLFGAQAVSLLGDGMVNVALAFAVIGLGGGAPEIGLVFTARSVALVGSLLGGGVVGDRLPRRAVLISADLVRVASQGALAAALIAGAPGVWTIALLSAITGAATGFFNPTSTAFLPAVVGLEALQPANALRGLLSSIGRVGGPAIAGLLVVAAGAGWALAVDALTFAVSALLLSRIRVSGAIEARRRKSFVADLREGWDSFRSRTWLWAFVAWFSFGNLLFGCWQIVGPLIAERDLGGADAWGLIIAASGAGGVVGGLVALRAHPRRPLLYAAPCLSVFFVPLALLAAGIPAVLIALGAAVCEIGTVLGLAVWESTLQRHVEPAALSRVSSYDWFGSLALAPVGLAIWGAVADSIGYETSLWLAFGLNVASLVPLLAIREIRTLPAEPPRVGEAAA
jgi:predicted MFS family arabinose efflux permease